MQESPLTFEEKVAATRHHMDTLAPLRGAERLAAGKVLLTEIAEGRAVPVHQLPKPGALPPRKKMAVVQAELREIIWDLAHGDGLRKAILDWTVDSAEAEGTLPPADAARWRDHDDAPEEVQLALTPETGVMAGTLLIEHRVEGHPFLGGDGTGFDVDHPLWAEDYPLPSGLVYVLRPHSGTRNLHFRATGSARLMETDIPNAGRYSLDEKLVRWLALSEVVAYLDANNV